MFWGETLQLAAEAPAERWWRSSKPHSPSSMRLAAAVAQDLQKNRLQKHFLSTPWNQMGVNRLQRRDGAVSLPGVAPGQADTSSRRSAEPHSSPAARSISPGAEGSLKC